ncbi:hypothetical protein HID58_003743 [Brassica napus]|uniref:non-specific serine/threonine protein kinase n=1 Tax=Brassica napus TaxID=3708 RepID=A0ABQ8EU15_BRANA|nr:hypothetical protein HID58_003743 [Brassica napus]
MATVGVEPSAAVREFIGNVTDVDRLHEEMIHMRIQDDKEMEDTIVYGNVTETGYIVTTIAGRNGQPNQAKCLETGETVAIKKVLQDRRYKNRELQTMRLLDHPNVVSLKHCFFSTTDKDELYLNLALEYVPETVHHVINHYSNLNQRMPLVYAKVYTYQIFRSLSYIHRCIGVCHRDIKPQNLLVNPHTHQVKLCDFGSAKVLPLFPGESRVDQLVEIIKVLGTPTREEIKCMNPNYTDFKFPQIKAHPWHKVFHKGMPPEAVDLVSRLLQYSPNLRFTAIDVLVHPFFDELRDPNGILYPPLFNFKPHELQGVPLEMVAKLVPEHARDQCPWLGL